MTTEKHKLETLWPELPMSNRYEIAYHHILEQTPDWKKNEITGESPDTRISDEFAQSVIKFAEHKQLMKN
tara:strand:+ start:575 stop:784 length:210 start_codon:yes stop_codon:yes gene_type:complete